MAVGDGDDQALGVFVEIETGANQARQTQLASLVDTRIVTGFAGIRIKVQPVGGGPEATVPAAAHVVAAIGDEVIVQKLGRLWVVMGNLSGREPVE